MASSPSSLKMNFRLDEAPHDRYEGEDAGKCFTFQVMVGSVSGFRDSTIRVTTYRPAQDPMRGDRWDEGGVGSEDAWQIFESFQIGRADYSKADLGYPNMPRNIVFLDSMLMAPGLGQTNAAAYLLREAVRAVDPSALVIADFGGQEFNSTTGRPTARGLALQLGFVSTSPHVVALPQRVLLELIDRQRPMPAIQFRSPVKKLADSEPVFDGRVFPRDVDSLGQFGKSRNTFDGFQFRSSESILHQGELRHLLLCGLTDGSLTIRPGDPRGANVQGTSQRRPAFIALGNDSFEVALNITDLNSRPHPWRCSEYVLSDLHVRWLSFLLHHSDLGFALDAFSRVAIARWETKYDVVNVVSAHDMLEIGERRDPSDPAIVLIGEILFLGLGYSPDGNRRVVLPLGQGNVGPAYVRLSTSASCTWTKKAAQEHVSNMKRQEKARRVKSAAKSSSKPTKRARKAP